MIRTDIIGDVKEVEKLLGTMSSKITPRATVTSLNKTITQVRNKSVREIRGKIKAKTVKDRLRIRKAKITYKVASIFADLRGIPAYKAGNAKQTKRGVRVGGEMFGSAFIATMPSGRTGVFSRKSKKRLPIKEQYIPLVDNADKIIERNTKVFGAQKFKEIFEHEVQRRLDLASR